MVCSADTVTVRVARLSTWQEVLSSLQKATRDVKVWNGYSPAVTINLRLEALFIRMRSWIRTMDG